MSGYLIRRLVQMAVIILLSAAASYALMNFVPGGPLAEFEARVQTDRNRITPEDIQRIRSYYELDLNLPVRFSRWLIGFPSGPLRLAGNDYFSDWIVGCRKPLEQQVEVDGRLEMREVGCDQNVTLADLTKRRTSRGILRGDFGLSWTIKKDRPVSELIESRLPKTLELTGIAILLSILIGVPVGIYSAVKQYSRFDYFFTSLAFIGSAMPTFFFGILVILFFSVIPKTAGLPYLPPGSAEATRNYLIPGLGMIKAGSFQDELLHLILPVAVLTLVSIAGWSRFIRASVLEVMRQDYIRTARAKGLAEKMVILKHALRNALIPFVTIIVFSIPAVFSGAVITETIFSWPGMGRLYYLALGVYDYPVAMAILFISAVLTVIATLVRDVVYTMVDPRIRFN